MAANWLAKGPFGFSPATIPQRLLRLGERKQVVSIMATMKDVKIGVATEKRGKSSGDVFAEGWH